MLRLSSGRVIFFEGITSFKKKSIKGIQIELNTKECIDLPGTSEEEFLTRRDDYFQELHTRSEVGEAVTLAVLDKLKDRITSTVNTLDAVSSSYQSSADKVTTAADSITTSTERLERNSSSAFNSVVAKADQAARKFTDTTDSVVEKKIKPMVSRLQKQVEALEAELAQE